MPSANPTSDPTERLIAAFRDALADQRRSFHEELRQQTEATRELARECLAALKSLERSIEGLR